MWHLCGGARKPVQKSIAQLIATIAKHDLSDNRWPALFQFLEQYVRSDSAVDREVHLQISVIFFHCCILRRIMEESGIKVATSCLVCCCNCCLAESEFLGVDMYKPFDSKVMRNHLFTINVCCGHSFIICAHAE